MTDNPGHVFREHAIWAFHNLVAHPLSEVCYWLGWALPPVARFGNWLHDWSIPADHREGRG